MHGGGCLFYFELGSVISLLAQIRGPPPHIFFLSLVAAAAAGGTCLLFGITGDECMYTRWPGTYTDVHTTTKGSAGRKRERKTKGKWCFFLSLRPRTKEGDVVLVAFVADGVGGVGVCVCVGASLSVFLPPLRSLSLPICPLPVPERKEEREASVCMSTQYNLLRTVKRRSTSLVDHALLEEQRTMHAWTLRDIRHGREGGGQTNTAAASERRKKRKGHLAD